MSYICNVDSPVNQVSVFSLDVTDKIELLDKIHDLFVSEYLCGTYISASTQDGKIVMSYSIENYPKYEMMVLEHGFDHILNVFGKYKGIDVAFSFQQHKLTQMYIMTVIISKDYAYIEDDLLLNMSVL